MAKVGSGILFWNLAVPLFVKTRLRWGKECRDYRIEAVATTGQLARKPAMQLKVQWGSLPSWIKKKSTEYVIHSFPSCYFTFLMLVGFIKTLKELDQIFPPKHISVVCLFCWKTEVQWHKRVFWVWFTFSTGFILKDIPQIFKNSTYFISFSVLNDFIIQFNMPFCFEIIFCLKKQPVKVCKIKQIYSFWIKSTISFDIKYYFFSVLSLFSWFFRIASSPHPPMSADAHVPEFVTPCLSLGSCNTFLVQHSCWASQKHIREIRLMNL